MMLMFFTVHELWSVCDQLAASVLWRGGPWLAAGKAKPESSRRTDEAVRRTEWGSPLEAHFCQEKKTLDDK